MTTTNNYISTPGEILKEEFLDPLGISQYRLAKAIQKPQSAVSEIIRGTRAITPEMAVLLGRALRTSPQFWMNLETTYRMKTVDLEKIHAEEVPDLIACVG
jgi:addiction module HigA family antidote